MVVADMPDNVTATSVAITVSATGLAKTRITPLLTAEEVDFSVEKEHQLPPTWPLVCKSSWSSDRKRPTTRRFRCWPEADIESDL